MRDFTDRMATERAGLETQVRQLKMKVPELEGQLHEAQEDNNRLINDVKDRYNENESLKTRYLDLERKADSNVRDLQDRMEKQKLADIDEIMRKANSQYQIDRMSLESQIASQQQKLQEYENKLALLSMEIKRLTEMNLDKANELEDLKIQYGSLEKNAQIRMEQMRVQLEIQHRNEKVSIFPDYRF